jgi:hypothetical protein
MNTRQTVDWISLTYPTEVALQNYPKLSTNIHELAAAAGEIMQVGGAFTPQRARHGYALVVQNQDGAALLWDSDKSRQGMHLSYSGTTLNGVDAPGVLGTHIGRGARITRLDIALDLLGAEMPVGMMAAALQARKDGDGAAGAPAGNGHKPVLTNAQRWSLIESDSGTTLYVGARSSTAFVRIYDKAAETGSDDRNPWWRVEVELKGARAHKAAIALLRCGVSAARGIVRGVVHFPGVPEWEFLIDYEQIMSFPSDTARRDTDYWLINSVAKTLARRLDFNPALWGEFQRAVVEHLKTDISDI